MNQQLNHELVQHLQNKDVSLLNDYEKGLLQEVKAISEEPKIIWGRNTFDKISGNRSEYEGFIQELLKYGTKDTIQERKNDSKQWRESENEGFYWIDARFSEREVLQLLIRFKGSFTLLEGYPNTTKKDSSIEVDREWLQAFVEEEKALFGKMPSVQDILENWKNKKEHFLANKDVSLGLVNN